MVGPVPRRWGPLSALAVAVGLIAIPAPASAAPYVRLSDERTWTRSAFVDFATQVRAAPKLDAAKVSELPTHTFHGRPEVVLVLGTRELGGRTWLRIRYPGLGRRVGWVTQRVLSGPRLHRTLVVVDRGARELRLLRNDKVVRRVPVGVGASASPTPPGRYYIRERLDLASSSSIYGALAFGTSAFSRYRTDWPGGGQVGIHGTNQPELIPGYISNGCVRLRNADILALGRRIEVGTPVLIK
jgi:lipoprotein-anchoring transpeptidase ErfK/SrfK